MEPKPNKTGLLAFLLPLIMGCDQATPFSGRSHVFPDYSLEVENLTSKDAGEYTVTLSEGPWELTGSTHLFIFEPIRRTVIRTENAIFTNQSCVASFSCLTEGGSTVSYTWRTGVQWETVLGSKEHLQVSLNGSSNLSALVCIASNPVSSQNATVDLTTTCVVEYPETALLSSGPFSISIVSFGGCFFLLLAASIVYWTHRSRRGRWVNRAPVLVSSQKKRMEGQHQEDKDHVPQVATEQTEPTVPPDSPSQLNDAETDFCEVQAPTQTSNSVMETEV
ncbi:SLAM family member 7-like isoform X2 [Stegostoma tigrinum]|uniref:SLAM family member 7-like isoform X2 n=1 Tax=Stegostoma tigrinum TaxID=3053191 RepID=UPI00286FE049|nr:SLAM family member 7-like isoform X2 [Stegostoma tigrinum]